MTPVALLIVNDVSYAMRINRACRFIVQSSTGVILCSTEKYFVVLCSTGVVLRSTE